MREREESIPLPVRVQIFTILDIFAHPSQVPHAWLQHN